MKLGQILVQEGKLTASQLDGALGEQLEADSPKRLGDLLVANGVLRREDVMEALGRQYHLPVLGEIRDELIDASLLEGLPVDWVRQHLVFPVRHQGAVVALLADPVSLPRLEELSILIGEELSGMLASEDQIRKAADRAYFERRQEVSSVTPEPVPAPAAGREDDLLRVSDSAPVTQLVNTMILNAVRQKASDIHVEPYEHHLRVRFRVDGFLYEQASPPKQLESALISRLKVMSKLDISERRLPQDGMAKVRAGDREIDIRVSTVPVAEGERVVLRLLNQASTLLPLSELGIPESVISRFREVMKTPNGIILVTGPTGSGKTTSLYAALGELDTAHLNVITIEDPVEYQMPEIGQIQVRPKIGLTFAAGLRHILRQDPDVILVGEMRDQETAEIAVRAALTGHLVFSTLHTNDAASALVRLFDMGVQPYLIASSVRAILAQRLVRRLCRHCRQPSEISMNDIREAGRNQLSGLIGKPCYRPTGCAQCLQGYQGRVGLYELLHLGDDERDVIRADMNVSSLRAIVNSQGCSMMSDAITKVHDGVTSLEEIMRVLNSGNWDHPG